MKQLNKDLQAVLKSLKEATEKTENLMKKVEEIDKPKASKKPRVKALPKAKAPKKGSDSDMVLAINSRSKKGADGATLRKKTGFEDRKIRDICLQAEEEWQDKG